MRDCLSHAVCACVPILQDKAEEREHKLSLEATDLKRAYDIQCEVLGQEKSERALCQEELARTKDELLCTTMQVGELWGRPLQNPDNPHNFAFNP